MNDVLHEMYVFLICFSDVLYGSGIVYVLVFFIY